MSKSSLYRGLGFKSIAFSLALISASAGSFLAGVPSIIIGLACSPVWVKLSRRDWALCEAIFFFPAFLNWSQYVLALSNTTFIMSDPFLQMIFWPTAIFYAGMQYGAWIISGMAATLFCRWLIFSKATYLRKMLP